MSYRLETTAGQLRAALGAVSPVVERYATHPILACVLFQDATVTGTNLDVEIVVQLAAKSAQGCAAIELRPLLALVRSLPADTEVTLSGGNHAATLAFEGGQYGLSYFGDADGFPVLPVERASKALALDGQGFGDGLRAVLPFVSDEATRYYLNGVAFSTRADGAGVLVATDGHRLARYDFDYPAVLADAIVPTLAVKTLLRLGPVATLARAANGLTIEAVCPGARVRAKLIDGTFPDWKRVWPQRDATPVPVVFDAAAMQRTLKRMAAVKVRCVELAWQGEVLAAVGLAKGAGDHPVRERVMLRAPAQGGGIAFNPAYLSEILRAGKSDQVTAWVGERGAPAAFEFGGPLAAVLMPMRVSLEGEAQAALAQWMPREVAA